MHYAEHPKGKLIRHVQYICMTSAKFAKKEDLELKANFVQDMAGHYTLAALQHSQARAATEGGRNRVPVEQVRTRSKSQLSTIEYYSWLR